MSLPKRGVAVDELRCKVCRKGVAEQPNDISKCLVENCPYPKKTTEESSSSAEEAADTVIAPG